MVLHQLYSNLKASSQLKRNGKQVGRLRFKGKGWYKTFIYNQTGFKLIKTGKRLDLLHLSKIGDTPIRVHKEVEGEIKQIIIKNIIQESKACQVYERLVNQRNDFLPQAFKVLRKQL